MQKIVKKGFCTFQKEMKNSKAFTGYFQEPLDLEHFRKQIIYRCGKLGMLELDILLGRWSRSHVPQFDLQQCQDFNDQVLKLETPDLWNILISQKNLSEKEIQMVKSNPWLLKLVQFADSKPFTVESFSNGQ